MCLLIYYHKRDQRKGKDNYSITDITYVDSGK